MSNDVLDTVRVAHELPATGEFPASLLSAHQAAGAPAIVFNPDTRTQVKDTKKYPWNAMGQLIMTFPNGEEYTGSGTLVDQRHVLTAAHNVFGNDIGGWAKEVWFVPARNGSTLPYDPVQVTKAFVTEEYQTLSPADPNATTSGNVVDATHYTEDYALLRLAEPLALPIFNMLAASELKAPARITGYPDDKPYGTMWTDEKKLTNFDEHFLFYKINTYKGQSGAGIIVDMGEPGGEVIVGVHVAGSTSLETNFGVRLDSEKVKRIRKWMSC